MINLKTKEWEIKNIDTVIFDKDGTLVDLHYFWGKMTEMRIEEIIKVYNLRKNAHKSLCQFLGFDTTCQKMLPEGITALYSRPKIIELLIEELKTNYQTKTTNETIESLFNKVSDKFYLNLENYVKPIDEAIIFAEKLKKAGLKLGIVTADSIISTNKTLKTLKIVDLFDVIIARESHPERKETGKPTLFALEKLNASPKNAIMIGDTPIDCESAKKAGIEKTILVSTGQMNKEELKKYSNYALNSISEIEIERIKSQKL